MRRPSHLQSQAGAVLLLVVLAVLVTGWRSAAAANDFTEDSVASTSQQGDSLSLLQMLQGRFAKVANQVSPSVVAISAPSSIVDATGSARTDEMSPDKLRSMIDRAWRMVGTGFVIDPDGYIVTSEHVIKNAQQIWITTDDRKVYPAMVVGSDPRMDLAVIKIPAKDLPVVRLGKYDGIQRGQWTIALGNPHGLAAEGQMSMTIGVVSALGRSLPDLAKQEDRLYVDLIQTSAQINPGNSGGPLLNLDGEVIGVNTATTFGNGNANGIGFAIPLTDRVMARINSMKRGCEVVAGYLGVTVTIPTPQQRAAAKLPAAGGAYIERIEPESPAAECGLKVGDIITEMDGEAVHSSDHLSALVCSCPVGTPIKVAIRRDDRSSVINVTLRRRQLPNAGIWRESQRLRWRGLLLAQASSNCSDGHGKTSASGVMVLGVEKDSPLSKQGVTPGSIITSIGSRPVRDLLEMLEIINDVPAEQCHLQLAAPPVAATAQCNSHTSAN
ncbi:MAG: trypsin-like peptidase domain-containing protein [Bacillota bacterium]